MNPIQELTKGWFTVFVLYDLMFMYKLFFFCFFAEGEQIDLDNPFHVIERVFQLTGKTAMTTDALCAVSVVPSTFICQTIYYLIYLFIIRLYV